MAIKSRWTGVFSKESIPIMPPCKKRTAARRCGAAVWMQEKRVGVYWASMEKTPFSSFPMMPSFVSIWMMIPASLTSMVSRK